MGLDFLELVLEIEEKFNISFVDGELRNVETFGDVLTMLEKRMQETQIPLIDYPETLEEVQNELRILVPNCGDLSETTQLSKIFRFGSRFRLWNAFKVKFPVLPVENVFQSRQMISYLNYMGITTFASTMSLGLISWISWFKYVFAILFLGWITAFFLGVIYFISQSFSLPYKTVGDLTKAIVQRQRRIAQYRQTDREELADELREIFRNVLALDSKTEIRLDTRLHEDLHVG